MTNSNANKKYVSFTKLQEDFCVSPFFLKNVIADREEGPNFFHFSAELDLELVAQ